MKIGYRILIYIIGIIALILSTHYLIPQIEPKWKTALGCIIICLVGFLFGKIKLIK